MKQKKLAAIVLIVVIALGFIFPLFIKDYRFCAERECSCNNKASVECSTCSSYNPRIMFIIVNLGKVCQGKEVIACQENSQVNKEIIIDNEDCRYVWNSIFSEIGKNRQAIDFGDGLDGEN